MLVGHRQAAELLLKRLNGHGLYTTGISFPTCITRHLGGAAALLGRYDEARKHYQEAIRVSTEMRFRPELALTRLQLAELLLGALPGREEGSPGAPGLRHQRVPRDEDAAVAGDER